MATSPTADRIYANSLAEISGFQFDQQVAAVFPDMIERSVPGYGTIINMIANLAERYGRDSSRCYDLGCSLGAAAVAIQRGAPSGVTEIIAVDTSQAMLERCRNMLPPEDQKAPIRLIEGDVCEQAIENASLVVLNFTLQFISVEKREALLQNICNGLLPGGILVLSEKVTFADKSHNQLMIELHHNFKRANGYSDLEIAQKRTALENVLIPETLESHRSRLKNVGFDSFDVWFQCFNFASMIAVKA